MRFYIDTMIDGLEELSDADVQGRLWTGQVATEMSSFDECVERIFGDSRLDRALARGQVFDPSTDEQLRELGALTAAIHRRRASDTLLQTPELQQCRALASTVLDKLQRSSTPSDDESDRRGESS